MKWNIHKKEGGSYYVVSANKASSVTLQSPGNESQRKHTSKYLYQCFSSVKVFVTPLTFHCWNRWHLLHLFDFHKQLHIHTMLVTDGCLSMALAFWFYALDAEKHLKCHFLTSSSTIGHTEFYEFDDLIDDIMRNKMVCHEQ